MTRLAIVLAAVAALASPAVAADLPIPTKAPASLSVLATYTGAGTYYGIHTFADNQKLDANTGLGGSFAVGAAVGLTGGYMWGNGTSWQAIEAMASYKNISASGAGIATVPAVGAVLMPASIDSTWSATERFKLGGPITSVLNVLPSFGTIFPALPQLNTGASGTTHPYVFAALHEDDVSASLGFANGHAWRISGGFGLGMMQQLSKDVSVDVWAEYIPAGSSTFVGAHPIIPATGRETRIGLAILY